MTLPDEGYTFPIQTMNDTVMNVGIVGYRGFNDYATFEEEVIEVLVKYPQIPDNIVTGGCKGTDQLAERFAEERGISTIVHYPIRGEEYSPKAYLDRNIKIVADSTILIAFVSEKSKGTYHTISHAKKKGIPVHIIDV